jgi:hypothetical protein
MMFLRKLRVAGLVLLATAVTASGIGWLSHRPATPAAQAAPPAAAKKVGKQPAAPVAKLEEKQEPGKPGTREAELVERMERVIDSDGWDDPKTSLIEALDQLEKVYRLTISINEKAFREARVDKVRAEQIVMDNPSRP